jgi:hypothetical protein
MDENISLSQVTIDELKNRGEMLRKIGLNRIINPYDLIPRPSHLRVKR